MNYTRQELITILHHYVEIIFPTFTDLFDWPVRFNHCFRRIIYDNVMECKWCDVIDYPAIQNLSYTQLLQCIKLCDDVLKNPCLLIELNNKSLSYRNVKSSNNKD